MTKPEDKAREHIDSALTKAGWSVQDMKAVNLKAARGVAIREFSSDSGYGEADYLLYVDGKAAGVVEAKPVGSTLTGVEIQTDKYSKGLPATLPAYIRPLPFLYESTGVETHFTNGLDPEPKSRQVFNFHRPEKLAEWISAAGMDGERPVLKDRTAFVEAPYLLQRTLRGRLLQMPPLQERGLWAAQVKAIKNLEQSLQENRPRALIQMMISLFVRPRSTGREEKKGSLDKDCFLSERFPLTSSLFRVFDMADLTECL